MKQKDQKTNPATNDQPTAPTTEPTPTIPKAAYDELVDTLQRLQAEFENHKKRVEKEAAEHHIQANADLLRQFLQVLDNFELALNHATPAERQEGLYKGVELIYAQLLDLLETNEITTIQPAEGERFDPYKHEAMLTEHRDGTEKNTILEVLQRGYMLKERILRTAKVKVAK